MMHRTSASLDRLFRDQEREWTRAVSYSQKSLYWRCQPLVLTSVLASIAILGSIALCECTRAEGPLLRSGGDAAAPRAAR